MGTILQKRYPVHSGYGQPPSVNEACGTDAFDHFVLMPSLVQSTASQSIYHTQSGHRQIFRTTENEKGLPSSSEAIESLTNQINLSEPDISLLQFQ